MNVRQDLHTTPNVLSIDIGNSLTKLALMNQGNVLEKMVCKQDDLLNTVSAILSVYGEDLKACAWINVNEKLSLVDSSLWDSYPHISLLPINFSTDFPIENLYATPHTLGTDRLVAIIGAQRIVAEGAILVIDAGTAITYDFANESSQYLGGGIAPGISMRFRALHEFTARLPLLEVEDVHPLIGDSTESSILSGVLNGAVAELQGIIERYRSKQNGKISVLLTGGDAPFFEKRLKNINFASSNLIHFGIYRILSHLNFT